MLDFLKLFVHTSVVVQAYSGHFPGIEVQEKFWFSVSYKKRKGKDLTNVHLIIIKTINIARKDFLKKTKKKAVKYILTNL